MRPLLELLARFRRDDRGAFAEIFAIAAIVLIAMSGAVVDFTSLQQSRTRAQVALDAAALALQPNIYNTNAATTIQTQAQALLVSQLADAVTTWGNCNTNGNVAPCAYVATPTIDTTNGQLTLSATVNVPMNFVRLVGVQNIPAQVESVATRKKLYLEVAMVLDNSGSMAYTMGYNKTLNPNPQNLPSRMQTLQSSATCASNILFYGVSTCTASTTGLTANANVKIGLVPFTQFVNVGSSNSSASWLDRTGAASITLNNFDTDDNPTNTFSGTVDRVALANSIKYNGSVVGWGGCVEARINNGSTEQYDTDDTPPTTGDTLYTPAFAPDEPGSPASAGSGELPGLTGQTFYNSYLNDSPTQCTYAAPSCTQVSSKTNCSSSTYSNCSSTATTVTTLVIQGVTTHPTTCSYVTDEMSSSTSNTVTGTTGTGSHRSNVYTDTQTLTYASLRADQERMCKYGTTSNPVTMSSAPVQGNVYGPNGDCPANSVQPLTSTPGTITSAISNMAAQGGTNISEGMVWGWHTLSPNSPFTSKGAAYSTATSKVIILMTDGENTIYPELNAADAGGDPYNMNYDEFYSAYGFPWNDRLGVVSGDSTTLATVMNTRLGTICTNAKAAGVTIYTIGVDVADTSNPTNNTSIMQNCATTTSDAYFPNTAADLQSAFVSIANQLAALRLSK